VAFHVHGWLFLRRSGIFDLAYQVGRRPLPHGAVQRRRDIAGVMADGAALFFPRPKPPASGNTIRWQKLAYTSTIGFRGSVVVDRDRALQASAVFPWLAFLFGDFHLTRNGIRRPCAAFYRLFPVNLIMVAFARLVEFCSMLRGGKREPEVSGK